MHCQVGIAQRLYSQLLQFFGRVSIKTRVVSFNPKQATIDYLVGSDFALRSCAFPPDSLRCGRSSSRSASPRHGRLQRLGQHLLERAARLLADDTSRALRRVGADPRGRRGLCTVFALKWKE